jgi:hypothetical protein
MPRVKQLATWKRSWWLCDLIAGSHLREFSYTHNRAEEGESRGNVTVVSQLQNSMMTVPWLSRANFTAESRF